MAEVEGCDEGLLGMIMGVFHAHLQGGAYELPEDRDEADAVMKSIAMCIESAAIEAGGTYVTTCEADPED
jgi:hypothetical protein